jgi:D-specific alpha-keto acid dehydrogenase
VVRNAKNIVGRAAMHDFRLNDSRGKELRDMTIGVVGTGRIGTSVIERLRGFGCRIVAHDHRPKVAVEYLPIDTLLQQSDLVALHTPLTEKTRHLLDRRRIGQLKPGAFVVNTGRGALLDTGALIDALERGALGGAALDVLEGEEDIFYADCRDTEIQHKQLLRLEALSTALVTPHTAYYTEHALHDTVENSIRNCLAFETASRDARRESIAIAREEAVGAVPIENQGLDVARRAR